MHDSNRNLTRDETGRQFVYDAWNRLVEVKDASGNTLKSYAYDGQHRRISETAGGTTTDLYYSSAWQVLEERVTSGGTSVPRVVYVWSPVYADALVLCDRDTNGDGTLDERLYVAQDANYNVTAIFDNAGNVVERYAYDPFGQVTVLDAGWGERAASAFGWLYLHQGGRFDATSGLYHFRHRDYSPTLGRWISLDPIRYAAGDVNLYRALGNGPAGRLDPSGLIWYPGKYQYQIYTEWLRGRELDEKLSEVQRRNHDPIAAIIQPGGGPWTLRDGYGRMDPAFEREWCQGMNDASVLANVGVTWAGCDVPLSTWQAEPFAEAWAIESPGNRSDQASPRALQIASVSQLAWHFSRIRPPSP